MRAVVVIPTFNEAENISSLVGEILDTTEADVIVVDDDSPDDTGVVADRMAETEPRLSVIHRLEEVGLGGAYLAGFSRALERGYDYIIQMDADFSHQPRYLPRVLAALEDSEVVIGSRYVPGGGVQTWGIKRRALSYGANLYARAVFGMPQRDLTAGFVGFRRYVLEAIGLDSIHSDSYGFQLELKYRAHRLGFTLTEVPIVFYDRVVGQSKLGRRTIPKAFLRVAQLRLTGKR